MRRILVIGRGGQLATSLATTLPSAGFECMLVGQPEFEFDQPASIPAAFTATMPDAVVNCAAWTAVDAAEDHEAAAFRANAQGPGLIAGECAARRIPFIQISTDYVYDGNKTAPYVETDPVNPLSAYGRGKLAGEWAAQAKNARTIILRTSWLYSSVGKNFVKTMLAIGAQRSELAVVADQFGNPTSALHLAGAIAGILARIRDSGWSADYAGVFHATAPDSTSWHGFAQAIFTAAATYGAGPQPAVRAITTAEFPTKAVRPTNSRMNVERLQHVFGVQLPPWQAGLAQVVAELNGQ